MQTLRLFVEVARCHSFSQAAERHHITQSAASQRIQQLEKRLGVTLLDRSVRPLALTAAGQRYLAGCEELLEAHDRLEREVGQMHGDPKGLVRVAAIYSAGIQLLNQVRERFVEEHPRINVEIRYDQPEAVYHSVREAECDLGILSYPQGWRNVGVIPLRNEVMAVVCQPGHELARRSVVQVDTLSAFEMVGFSPDLPVARRLTRYLRENHANPRVTDVFDNIDTIKSAIAVTDRFAILPKRTVVREVAAGTLAAVDLLPQLVRPIGIIHRRKHKSGQAFGPAAQVFVDFLLEHAGPSVELIGAAEKSIAGNAHVESAAEKRVGASL